jgi:hypothetical protein
MALSMAIAGAHNRPEMTAAQYEAMAVEADKSAATVIDPEMRRQWLKMASDWRDLARMARYQDATRPPVA